MSETYYRYEDRCYGSVDEHDVVHMSTPRVECLEFPVLSRTPKGVWLDLGGNGFVRKFVLNESRKRYACPTREEAMVSFIARKTRQIKIHTAVITRARAALQAAQEIDLGPRVF